jgi:hypothetical protein
MAAKRNQSVGKARVLDSLPNLSEVEIGELIYVIATSRLYIRLITGWKYIATDG